MWIKGGGGVVGLTDIHDALRLCMVAGPEVARVIDEFHGILKYNKRDPNNIYHVHLPCQMVKICDLQEIQPPVLQIPEATFVILDGTAVV